MSDYTCVCKTYVWVHVCSVFNYVSFGVSLTCICSVYSESSRGMIVPQPICCLFCLIRRNMVYQSIVSDKPPRNPAPFFCMSLTLKYISEMVS